MKLVGALVVALTPAPLELILLRETGLGETHELIEHGELELQLDSVDHWLD